MAYPPTLRSAIRPEFGESAGERKRVGEAPQSPCSAMRRSAALTARLVGMGRPVLVSSARGLRTTRARTDLQLDSAPGGEVLFGLAQILIEARDGFEVRPDSR